MVKILLLLLRREVAFTGADLQIFLQGRDFDGAEAAIGVEVSGLVADDVLAAEFVFNGGVGVGDVLHLEGEEGAAASGFGELYENFVAAEDEAAVVGGDGVDDDFGALRHFDGLRAGDFALVILAIAHDHDRLARGVIGTVFQEFFFAGAVDGVVERRAAAILQLVYAGGEQLDVVGKVLRHLTLGVESNYEGFVEAGANRVLQETDGGILLEFEAAVDRSAYVDEQAEVQRQIGFAAEVENGLWRLVIVEDGEIGLIKVADKFAVLVGGNEQNVNFVDAFVNGEQRAGLGIVFRGPRAVVDAETGRAGRVSLGKCRGCADEGESR